MGYSRMKVKCGVCGLTWAFAIPFTTVEESILREHMAEHPHVNGAFAVRTFLGDISAEADIEILEQLYELEDDRDNEESVVLAIPSSGKPTTARLHTRHSVICSTYECRV